ncbi:MAG TPA: hypothetical protein ENH15_00190 [Actinobacteria bacterium]|nr:hypothetical protein [Actinomycetota bacterium]
MTESLGAAEYLGLDYSIQRSGVEGGFMVLAIVTVPAAVVGIDSDLDLVSRFTFSGDGALVGGEASGLVTLLDSLVAANIEWYVSEINVPFTVTPPDPDLVRTGGFSYPGDPQSDLRNALTATKVFYVDNGDYDATETELESIEPSLDFDSVANATNETLGFLVENDGQSIVFIVQDANGYWWCIADDVRAGGGTSYGLAENAFEIDTLEECSGSSW